jgi:hypothetical protein
VQLVLKLQLLEIRRSLCGGSLARFSVWLVRRLSQSEVISEDREVPQRINKLCAIRVDLTDEQWKTLDPLIPKPRTRSDGRRKS